MEKIYRKKEGQENGILEVYPRQYNYHFLGSPGLSKSLTFFMIKHFHDIRLKYILEKN